MLAEVTSRLLLQCVPAGGTLPVAVEAVQAMGRAQGGVLFFADDGNLTLLVSTIEHSRLPVAAELCAGVAEAGCARSGLAVAVGSDAPAERVAYIAIPLHADACLIGVLYLEGLADTSPRTEALVRRCAQLLARLLAHAAALSAPSTPIRGSKVSVRAAPDWP